MSVASTIIDQLGGGKFAAMTGAKNFIGSPNSVAFRIPGGGGFTKNGINTVKIVLDPSDTYTMTFSRIRGAKMTPVETISDVYAEDMQDIFTHVTGLYTHL